MGDKVFTERQRTLRGSRRGGGTRVTDHQEVGPKRNRVDERSGEGPAAVRARSFPPKRELYYTPLRRARSAARYPTFRLDAGRHGALRHYPVVRVAGERGRKADAGAVVRDRRPARKTKIFKRSARAGRVARNRGATGRPAGGKRAVRRAEGALGTFLLAHRGTLLWAGFVLVVVASLIPVYINVRSLFWERTGRVEEGGEALYSLFLDEGLGGAETVIVSGGEESFASGTALPADRSPAVVVPVLTVSKYEVKQGDSLYGVANRHGVPVDAVLSANVIPNPRYLKVGTVLRVPNMSGVFYRVKGGDSLYGIAHRYRVPVTGIVDINDLSSEVIHPGQELFLPGAALSEWERASALGTLFKRPARGRITSRVGFRIDPFTGKMAYHAGVDFANAIGTPVRATQYGRVSFAGYHGNYGKTVIIRHPDSYTTLYAHLDKILVKKGQAVRQEEKIGNLGNTGRSTGSHLHFEVHRNGKVVDPIKVLKLR